MKRTRTAACICGLALGAALLSGCGRLGGQQQAASPTADASETIYAVNTQIVSAGNLDEYLEFGGDVMAASSVSVLPDVSGKITRKLVSVGDRVTRNQIIAYVDPSRPGMNYNASPVRAPVGGRITSFSPAIGTMVSPSVSIAQISNTESLEIRVSVAERFISRIRTGQNAVLTFDAYPGVEFNAKVTEVSPVLDTATRTLEAKLQLSTADERIKVGMFGRVRLITDSIQDAIVIPANAIITREGRSYLFVVGGGRDPSVRLQPVTVGITVDNRTEITQGLAVGDEIVVKGQTLLNDGSRVSVIATDK